MRLINGWKYIYRKEADVVDVTLRVSAIVIFKLKYDHSDGERSVTLLNFRFDFPVTR